MFHEVTDWSAFGDQPREKTEGFVETYKAPNVSTVSLSSSSSSYIDLV